MSNIHDSAQSAKSYINQIEAKVRADLAAGKLSRDRLLSEIQISEREAGQSDPITSALKGSPEYDTNTGSHKIDRYLSEYKEWLFDQIKLNKKTAITSPTGSGKTTYVRDLVSKVKAGKLLGIKRVILAVPLQSIAGQQGKEIAGNYPVIMGGTSLVEIEEAAHSDLIICTWDALVKIGHLIDAETLLIIDEPHLLQQAYNYRDKAIKYAWNAQNKAGKVVTLSAHTPPGFIHFGYSELKLSTREHIKYPTTVRLYTTGSEAGVMRYHLANYTPGKGAVLVYMDDLDLLLSFADDVRSKGYTFTVISSKAKQYKEDNPDYIAIQESGKTATDPDFIFTTSIYEVGVNFLFEVAEIITINPTDHVQLAQYIARARSVNGINESIQLAIYKAAPNDEAARKLMGMIRKGWTATDRLTYRDHLNAASLTAFYLAQDLNEKHKYSEDPESYKVKASDNPDFQTVAYNDEADIYEPFAPAVMHRAWMRYMDRPFIFFWQDLRHTLPGLTLESVHISDLDELGKSEAVKERKEAIKEQTFALFGKDPETYIQAVYHATNDRQTRSDIRGEFGADRAPSEAVRQFTADHLEVIQSASATLPIKRLFKLLAVVRCLTTFNWITRSKAIQIVSQLPERSEFAQLYNRLVSLADGAKDARPIERLRHDQANRIKQSIRKAELMGTAVQLKQLTEIVCRITCDKDPQRNAMRIRELFTYERQGRKIVLTGYVTAAGIEAEIRSLFLEKLEPTGNVQHTEIQSVAPCLDVQGNIYYKTPYNINNTLGPQNDDPDDLEGITRILNQLTQ